MSTFTNIAGSPGPTGVAILDGDLKITLIENVAAADKRNLLSPVVPAPLAPKNGSADQGGATPKAGSTQTAGTSSKPNGAPKADGTAKPADADQKDAVFLCGATGSGIAIGRGNQVSSLNNLGNDLARWKDWPPLENGVKVTGITGDNLTGYTVISDSGVYQLALPSSKPEWKKLSPVLDFAPHLIAGDKSGLVIVGGDNNDRVVRSGADCCSWTEIAGAPFRIKFICGAGGTYLIYGEGQLAQLDAVKNTFTPSPRPNFEITAMCGNTKDGVVALAGGGDVVAYCTDVNKNSWVLSMVRKQDAQPAAANDLTGKQQPQADGAPVGNGQDPSYEQVQAGLS